MVQEVFEVLWWVNLILAIWGAIRLVEARVRNWHKHYSDKDQIRWMALMGGAVVGGEGSIENLLQDNSGGPRVILMMVYLIFTIWVTYMPDKWDKTITIK